jgi:hypothetical protein
VDRIFKNARYALACVIIIIVELILTYFPQFAGRHAPGIFFWVFFVIQVIILPISLGLYLSMISTNLRLSYRLGLGAGISIVVLLLYLVCRQVSTFIVLALGWMPTLYLLEHSLISIESIVYISFCVLGILAGWLFRPGEQ